MKKKGFSKGPGRGEGYPPYQVAQHPLPLPEVEGRRRRKDGAAGFLLGLTPFDRPGVEVFKTSVQAPRGRPGSGDRRKELEARLG